MSPETEPKNLSPTRFTTFDCLQDNTPRLRPIEDLSAWQFIEREEKDSVPLFCAAEFLPGMTRSTKNTLHINLAVMDIDSVGKAAVEDVLATLRDLGLEHIFYTTHSHKEGLAEGKYKCRIVLFFDRPAEPHEWPRVWAWINQDLGNGILDPNCKNPDRIYFLPSHPAAGKDTARLEHFEGEPIPVDFALENAPEVSVNESGFKAPTAAELSTIRTSLRYQMCKPIVEQMRPAIEKQGGDIQTLQVAMLAGDFGLADEEFWPLFIEWNATCKPPWDEEGLAKKLANARAYRKLPFAWRLAKDSFGDAIDQKDLKKFADKLAAKDGIKAARGRQLRKGLSGDPVGDDAKEVFWGIAEVLADKYPTTDPEALVVHLKTSIENTYAAGNKEITVEWMGRQIGQSQSKIHERKLEDGLSLQEKEAALISRAFSAVGIERSTVYTDEELTEFNELLGCKAAAFPWLVRMDTSIYFFIDGQYTRPYKDKESLNAAHIYLKPAQLPLTRMGAQGPVPLTMNELVDKYGTLADKVIVDMTAQKSSFDPKTSVITEAPCPFRKLEPKRSRFVEMWLRLITEDDFLHGKLLDWLACLPRIDKPCACLLLHGRKGVGKSFLAAACARLWTEGKATELADVAAAFNDMLANCPLVLGDEEVPQDRNGDPATRLLRKMIQEHLRSYKRKFLPTASLIGSMRMIITANSHDIIVEEKKALTDDDVKAINERFLCIEATTDKAETFLAKLKAPLRVANMQDKDDSETTEEERAAIKLAKEVVDEWFEGDFERAAKEARDFFEGDTVAQHVWWLNKNRRVIFDKRFLVEGSTGSDLETRLMVSTGLRSDVCHWIANYITMDSDASAMGEAGNRPIVDTDRNGKPRMLVTARMLHDLWAVIMKDDKKKPSLGAIEKALGGVAAGRVRKGSDKYRLVNLDRVKHWGVVVAGYSEEALDKGIQKLGLLP